MTPISPTPRKRKEDQEFKIVSEFEGSLSYMSDREEEEEPKRLEG